MVSEKLSPSNEGGREEEDSGTSHIERRNEKEESSTARKKLKGAEADKNDEYVRAVRDLTRCTSSSMG